MMTCISGVPDDVLLSKLDDFIGEKQEASTESPHIPHWAYKMTLKERPKEDFRKGQLRGSLYCVRRATEWSLLSSRSHELLRNIPNHQINPEINFSAIWSQFDTLLMGRRTYEAATRRLGRAERSAWVGTSSPSLTVFSISRVSISPSMESKISRRSSAV
jgi:hypothetical protein